MKLYNKYLRYRHRKIIDRCARLAETAYEKKNPTLYNAAKNIGKLIRRFDGD
ncbi:MAG: hypothetical protein GWP19_03875 [Planctomycetia bacterium]|nr:hypothetical protein [Planctomycetia bacterium]